MCIVVSEFSPYPYKKKNYQLESCVWVRLLVFIWPYHSHSTQFPPTPTSQRVAVSHL